MNNAKWLSLVEYFVLIGSGAGSIASIASQQLAFTAAPVSCLLLLNLLNRRHLIKQTVKETNTSIAHLDQRLSDEIKVLDQQVRNRPSFADLASVRKTIQQRHDNAIAQLQHNVSHRLSAIENRNVDSLEQELATLKTQYSQLSESLATVSQSLGRLATTNRIDGEGAIVQLQSEVARLQTKITEVATSQRRMIPHVMQDEIDQIHRRLNRLPQPFDGATLKQEIDGLVKVVGELVTRRDLAKLMAEVEKIRQQHQSLEQTVLPMRSINTIMRKQMETLSSWVATGHPASPAIEVEKLQATVTHLEDRLNTFLSGANLAKLQLDSSALQAQIKYLTSRLEVAETHLATLATPTAKSEYELMFNLSRTDDPFENTRSILKEALDQARSRVIVVFPHSDCATLDDELIQHFQAFLDRGGSLDIGWGHLGNEQAAQRPRYFHDRATTPRSSLKRILTQLTQLKRNYPTQFRFKVLGTNENFLICDSTYSILGLHPVATASNAFPEMAIGLRTQNASVIQGLIDRFDHPKLEAHDAIAYLNRALTRYELGDRQGAIKDYSSVIKLDSNHSIAHNNRGLIKFEFGDHAGAIEDFTAMLTIDAQNAVAYFHRGLVRSSINDQTGAIRDLKEAAWLFSAQGDQAKHQHAIEAIHTLRKRLETPALQLVREA